MLWIISFPWLAAFFAKWNNLLSPYSSSEKIQLTGNTRARAREGLARCSAWCYGSQLEVSLQNRLKLDVALCLLWYMLDQTMYSGRASIKQTRQTQQQLLLLRPLPWTFVWEGERGSNVFRQRGELHVDLVYLGWDFWILNSCINGDIFLSASVFWGDWPHKCALAIFRGNSQGSNEFAHPSEVCEWARCKAAQCYQDTYPSEDASLLKDIYWQVWNN